MRASILGWSAFSGLVLGLLAGLLVYAVVIVAGELAPNVIPRIGSRARSVAAFLTLVITKAPMIWRILSAPQG